ncbi:hypothetical protein DIS24_g8975 [Lasiodiplodia hormozganensis]|uniref:Uncharacterized protein n=1 Tax=Lasiodiplodia hormozganensis TaxID=869390 RepID=A0AA40CL73_9PEZI|nr:hypothetical protein DIS24_g8975 [Lasiodiplodia hormozganensis]
MTDRPTKRYNLRPRVSTEVGIARDGPRGLQPFRFADLPAEIRNEIYKLTLTTDEQVHLTLCQRKSRSTVVLDRDYALGLNPKFLLVNKAIYFEGRPILYENKFYFAGPNTLFTFLSSLSPTFKSWIRDITFDFENPPFWNARKDFEYEYLHYLRPAFTALIGTTNLKHLHLHFDAESYEPYTGEEADSCTEEEADSDMEEEDDSDMEYKEDFPSKFYEDAYLWLEELVRQKGSKEEAVKMIDISLRPEEGSIITGTDSRSTSILHERLVEYLS